LGCFAIGAPHIANVSAIPADSCRAAALLVQIL
jgi:hypothetical protein